jgi:phosphoribosylaminoimidazole (AIR) synthetase
MSVNDIVTSGAKPLFFLDYFATGHLDVDVAEQVMDVLLPGLFWFCLKIHCVTKNAYSVFNSHHCRS